MTTTEIPDLPLPKDPQHQRFADLRIRGLSLIDAYEQAGYVRPKGKRFSSSNAKRIENRRDVQAYMHAVRQQAAKGNVLTEQEKREYLARSVRLCLIGVNPTDKNDPGADLIKKVKIRRVIEDEQEFDVIEFEKVDPLKSIDLDNKLAGVANPEADAMKSLAEELMKLGRGSSPLPQDRL